MNEKVFLIGNNFLNGEALKYTLKHKGYRPYINSFRVAIRERKVLEIKPDILIWQEQLIEFQKDTIFECLQNISIACQSVFIISNKTFSMLGMGLTNGIQGYVHKQGGIKELENCLRSLEMNSIFISPLLTGNENNKIPYEANNLEASNTYLTKQEEKILQLVYKGETSKEIGSILNISPKTVKNHRQNMFNKLGLRGYGKLYEFSLEYFGQMLIGKLFYT